MKPEGQAAETPTPETYRFERAPLPGVGFGKLEGWEPPEYLLNIPAGPVERLEAYREARAMVDRELMEAIYVMLRVRP